MIITNPVYHSLTWSCGKLSSLALLETGAYLWGGGGLIEDLHQLRTVKYSQSYDFVCQMALLGGKGLSVALIKYNNIK